MAGWMALVVGAGLFLAKFYAYRKTGSQAVLSDALESVVNVVTALVTLTTLYVSVRPADEDHPYGHGKAEYFASSFEGGAIFFAGIIMLWQAGEAFFEEHMVRNLDLGLLIVLAAGGLNGALGWYLKKTGRRTSSLALTASGEHVLSDFWTSIGVVAGLFLVRVTGLQWIDLAAAGIVGLLLAATGFRLLIHSGSRLMDTEDRHVIQDLAQLFERHVFPGIIRIHHLRTMRSGSFHHVDLHIVVPEFWTVEQAHDHCQRFEHAVLDDYETGAELLFHLDPCRRSYCGVCDFEPCPVRQRPFRSRVPFTLEELTSPTELPDLREV